MQSIFCLAKAHKAVWIVEKNKADKKKIILLFHFGRKAIQQGRRITPG